MDGLAAAANLVAENPTFEAMYAFLRERYLHSRFEGRNDNEQWKAAVPKGITYSELVARSALEYLSEHGIGYISPYEAASGRTIKYDRSLTVLNPDEPPAQLGKKAPNLTHIYGQSLT
jgi:hypothetical protein